MVQFRKGAWSKQLKYLPKEKLIRISLDFTIAPEGECQIQSLDIAF